MTKQRGHRAVVSTRAVVQRLNRRLAVKGQRLKLPRGRYSGPFFLVDIKKHIVVREDVDVEKLARDTGALEPWEELEEIT